MRQTFGRLPGLFGTAVIITASVCVVVGIAAIVNFVCLRLYYW